MWRLFQNLLASTIWNFVFHHFRVFWATASHPTAGSLWRRQPWLIFAIGILPCGWPTWRPLKEACHRRGNHFQIFRGKKWKCPKDLGACQSLPGFLPCQAFPCKPPEPSALLPCLTLASCVPPVLSVCSTSTWDGQTFCNCTTRQVEPMPWWGVWSDTNKETYNYCQPALLLCFTIKAVWFSSVLTLVPLLLLNHKVMISLFKHPFL